MLLTKECPFLLDYDATVLKNYHKRAGQSYSTQTLPLHFTIHDHVFKLPKARNHKRPHARVFLRLCDPQIRLSGADIACNCGLHATVWE